MDLPTKIAVLLFSVAGFCGLLWAAFLLGKLHMQLKYLDAKYDALNKTKKTITLSGGITSQQTNQGGEE